MDSLSLPDGRTAVTGEERVLLSFSGERDRGLLRSWLDSEFEVLEGSPDSVESFDLCLVDERTYDAFEETFAERRAAATPTLLPVLVLASEPRAVPKHADDVVVVPTRTELLGSRVRSLLQTRSLTRELSLFRRAMDAATVGVSISRGEDDQPLVYVNEMFERITGYDREEVLGRNCRFLQGAETDPEAVAELRAVIGEGRGTTVVLRNYRADGTSFWNQVSVMPVREGGEVTHFLGFQQDVTERIEREHELERERSRFRSLAETASDAIVTIDADSVVRYANPAVESIFGYDPAEVVGESVTSLMPERFRESHLEGIDRFLEEGDRRLDWGSVTFPGRHADGHDIPLQISFATYEGVDGIRFTAIIRDVTEQVALEAELRDERDLLQGIFESSPVAIVLLDEAGEMVRANQRASRILGFDSVEKPNRQFDDVDWNLVDLSGDPIPSDDLPFARSLRGEHVHDYCHGIEVDGERRWLSVNTVPRTDADGDVTGVVAAMQDITDRIERERDLEQHETVVRSMNEAAWLIGADRRLTFANPQATAPIDVDPEDVAGEPITAFEDFFPDRRTFGRYLRYIDEILAGDREEAVLTYEVESPQERRVVELTLAPMHSDGDVEGVVGLSREITERVERDRRISVLDRVLRHNLRNKLNVVLANARDLADWDDPAAAGLATGIEAAAEELLDLSDTARRFESAIRPGEGAVEPIDLVAHVEHLLQEAEMAHGVDVEVSLCETAPTMAHESLELALEELVENAIVHGGESPSVAVVVTDHPEEGVVEVTVTDDGPGLPEMERAVLQRGTETPLEHMEGLGLWFANWTVTASGGSVSVRDNEPRGTVVTITLPRAP